MAEPTKASPPFASFLPVSAITVRPRWDMTGPDYLVETDYLDRASFWDLLHRTRHSAIDIPAFLPTRSSAMAHSSVRAVEPGSGACALFSCFELSFCRYQAPVVFLAQGLSSRLGRGSMLPGTASSAFLLRMYCSSSPRERPDWYSLRGICEAIA